MYIFLLLEHTLKHKIDIDNQDDLAINVTLYRALEFTCIRLNTAKYFTPAFLSCHLSA